jgi:Xaa-Pro aminopeptidase
MPVPFVDPAAYLECGSNRYVLTYAAELPLAQAVPGVETIALEELGLEELIAEGNASAYGAATWEALARGCEKIGLKSAAVPEDLPLGLADLLRSRGIDLRVDAELFAERRRVKSQGELEGVRRASIAADAAIEAIRARIATEGEVTLHDLRQLAWRVLAEHGSVPGEWLTIDCGVGSADPQEAAAGKIEPHQPIVLDIWPRDIASGCWADLTRTLCLGEPPERLRRLHEDVALATQTTIAAIKPGVSGEELNRVAAQCLGERGHATLLDSPAGCYPEEGMITPIGHGVGLRVHEEPILTEGCGPIVAGDILTVEPNLYYADLGGVRIEDLVLVTADGHELISDCAYGLEIVS